MVWIDVLWLPSCICVVLLVFVSSILYLCRPSCVCVVHLVVSCYFWCVLPSILYPDRDLRVGNYFKEIFLFFFSLSVICLAILLFYYSYTLHQKSFETLLLFIQLFVSFLHQYFELLIFI